MSDPDPLPDGFTRRVRLGCALLVAVPAAIVELACCRDPWDMKSVGAITAGAVIFIWMAVYLGDRGWGRGS